LVGAISNAFGVAIFVAAFDYMYTLVLDFCCYMLGDFSILKLGAIFLGIGLLIGGGVAAAIYLRRGPRC
jgi:hypothetical protein